MGLQQKQQAKKTKRNEEAMQVHSQAVGHDGAPAIEEAPIRASSTPLSRSKPESSDRIGKSRSTRRKGRPESGKRLKPNDKEEEQRLGQRPNQEEALIE